MRSDKKSRAMSNYTGATGDRTVEHVLSTIPNSLIAHLTGKQVGQVMSIRNAAYHEGKAQGIEIVDGCIYVDGIGLIPLSILQQIKISNRDHTTIYTLFAAEEK